MSGQDSRFHTRRGAALISALGMLVFLTSLGSVYVVYMSLEQKDALLSVQATRARHLAEGGIYAAIGDIQEAVQQGRVPETEYTFEIPLYLNKRGELHLQSQQVTVQVTDESALINVNHVEREVLEALNIPRAKARELRNKLPRKEIPSMERRTWLSSVQDLRTRGFVDGREYRELRTELMTVYSAANPESPRNFININSAPPGVLAALFNLTADESLALVQKRPFRSWDDVKRKIGKDPATFNVIENAVPNRVMPIELALTSRCFRIVSNTRMKNAFTSLKGMSKGVEAVVLIKDRGQYEFRFWSETPVELTEIIMAEGTGEEASSDADEAVEDEAAVQIEDAVETDSEGAEAEGTPAEGDTAGEELSDSDSESAEAATEDTE